jgi:hypothetical protein
VLEGAALALGDGEAAAVEAAGEADAAALDEGAGEALLAADGEGDGA